MIVRHRVEERAITALADGPPTPGAHDVYRVAVIGPLAEAYDFDRRNAAEAALRLLPKTESPDDWFVDGDTTILDFPGGNP